MWGLEDALNAPPQWHAYFVDPSVIPEEEDDVLNLGNKMKKTLQLTAGGEDSDDSMPELQSVSNSSDEESDDESTDSEADESDWESDDGYDTDQEDYLREMLREAMDAANEAEADLGVPGVDPLAQDEDFRKGNPFLKLLGSLRGNNTHFIFSSTLTRSQDACSPLAPRSGTKLIARLLAVLAKNS